MKLRTIDIEVYAQFRIFMIIILYELIVITNPVKVVFGNTEKEYKFLFILEK